MEPTVTPKILLTSDTALARPSVTGRALVVHHRDCEPPACPGACMAFAEFEPRCRQVVQGLDTLVFVGLNRAMTPANRTRDVWELLFNQTPGLRKISVYTTLFVSEPWRAWFHFGLVGAPYRDYTYSYIAESHHKAHRDGLRDDDPFALPDLLRWSHGVVASGYRQWFEPLAVEIVPACPETHARYAEIKRAAFEEESAVNPILARLVAFAGSACRRRRVPSPGRLFAARRHEVVATDLPVDRWLVGRLQHLIELVNGVAEGCFDERHGEVQECGRADGGSASGGAGVRPVPPRRRQRVKREGQYRPLPFGDA